MARPEELSGQIWPIHLKPFDDELLSCWMVRLAHAYGVKPVWFWNRVWKRDAVAYRFVDRSAPVELLRLLSAGTGTRYERVLPRPTCLAEVRSIWLCGCSITPLLSGVSSGRIRFPISAERGNGVLAGVPPSRRALACRLSSLPGTAHSGIA